MIHQLWTPTHTYERDINVTDHQIIAKIKARDEQKVEGITTVSKTKGN
jgi:hypothetical protein